MELKVKYHYTYFIKPFLIEQSKYSKYLLSLLNNKNCKLKIFEKERDLNLYSYFIQNVREYFFPTFTFDRNKINNLDKMQNNIKASELSKLHCNIFEYRLDKKVQGKISTQDGIFFNIDKIEIICLDTGICFLLIKTYIENSEKFSDLLNFNYKFKDINSDFTKLKDYNNIKIQTDAFGNMTEISDFIDNIIGFNDSKELENIDLYNKRFFVYTYSCIEQEDWNEEEDFKNLENDFLKFSNVLSNNSTLDFDAKELKQSMYVNEQFRYARFGFTKQSASLMTSSIDINNYTKILFDYENEYLYTLIIGLYQRIYLKKLENDFKSKNDIEKVRKNFYKFTKEIALSEITNSLTGTMFYNKWKKIFELRDIYDEIKNKYDVLYKELNIDKNIKVNKFILIALVISLLLNVVNFVVLIRLR
ncbi:MAG: hypothetical protein IJB90_01425 [Clostridia bacterium]|nr:hypothetical protein [Clostridia bacterium]